MKMPEIIETIMLAPCGMNCMVCYKHVQSKKDAKPCEGCLLSDDGKPERCRKCKIKECCEGKNHSHCYECLEFPCKLIKNLEKSYMKRYEVSLIENSILVKRKGIVEFMKIDREKWVCVECGGVFSLHDGYCSECKKAK